MAARKRTKAELHKIRSEAADRAWETRRRKAVGGKRMEQPTLSALLGQLDAIKSQVERLGAAPEVLPLVPLEGPDPETLVGTDLLSIAAALNDAEAAAAADRDGQGKEYAKRAAAIRFIIWTRKFVVRPERQMTKEG